jgi:hypothetical protein
MSRPKAHFSPIKSIMNTPSFLILADRGHLLAYALDHSTRTPTPRLIDSMDFIEGHQRLSEQVTDKAGAFPAGNAGQATATAERMTLMAELEMRTFRHVAERITKLLETHRPKSWAFAAPGEINGAIIDGLDPKLHARLTKNVARDLTNVPPGELLGHFDRVQA